VAAAIYDRNIILLLNQTDTLYTLGSAVFLNFKTGMRFLFTTCIYGITGRTVFTVIIENTVPR